VPEDNPSMRGRYRFTLAHELAHWRLHRHLYLRRASARPLVTDVTGQPDHVFRSGAPDPKEFQANQLAACILMPREMVKRAWHEQRGSMDPIYVDDLRARRHQILAAEVLRRGGMKAGDDAIDNMLLEHASRPLAETFQVSPDAMRIRLEGLKLLLRKKEPSLFA
jgi:Zn-dependent peptidase ImmA (M78 family)